MEDPSSALASRSRSRRWRSPPRTLSRAQPQITRPAIVTYVIDAMNRGEESGVSSSRRRAPLQRTGDWARIDRPADARRNRIGDGLGWAMDLLDTQIFPLVGEEGF